MDHEIETTGEAPPSGGSSRRTGTRRAIAMALLAAGLLAVGGTAAALAADPSATPAPAATATPDDGATAAPEDGTTTPDSRPDRGGHRGDCPDPDGSDGTDTDAGSGTAPTTPDELVSPDPGADPADA